MIKQGICVAWRGSLEYIALDFRSLAAHTEIYSTLEWWTAERLFVSYVTNSSMKRTKDGAFQLKIRYEKKRNSHIPSDVPYGVSTIFLNEFQTKGEAYWHETGKRPEKNPAVWTKVQLDIVKNKKKQRAVVTKTERQQAMFRLALLAQYRSCAITRESTPSALEAAHIVASRKGGAEILANGILLRADIHRLYDSGAFFIKSNGKIVVNPKATLSGDYKKILMTAKLAPTIVTELREALGLTP